MADHLRRRSRSITTMIEADARTLLRDCGGFGCPEAWIAGRRWNTAPGGWTATGELRGCQLRVDVVAGGLRISASAPLDHATVCWTAASRFAITQIYHNAH